MSLASLVLFTSASRPAQAQYYGGGWGVQQCDAQGNPTSSIRGTETGQITNTYPAAMFDVGESGFYPFIPNGTALNGHFYDDTIGVDPPATSVDAGNSWYNGYGYSGTYSGTDASGNRVSGPVNGSVTVHLDGQIPAYFKEVWQGYGAPTTPMPDHIDFLLNTEVSASASVNYGSSGLSSGLSATATAKIDQFKETATASAGDAGAGSVVNDVKGHHLVRASVDPGTGIAEVYLNGTTDWTASNQVPYMVPSSGGSTPPKINGNTDASAYSYVNLGIQPDSREVEITSPDIETSYQFGPLDPNTNAYPQDVRASDGSIVTDSAVSPPLTQPGGGSSWTSSPGMLGQAGGFTNPVFAWSMAGGQGSLSASGNTSHTQLSVQFPLSSTDKALNKQSTVRLDVTDSDGATAANTFTVRWHYPKENAKLIASGTPFWQEAERKSVTSVGYINGDATGTFGYSTYTDLYPAVAADIFPVVANGTPSPDSYTTPIWSAFVAAVGLAVSQIQPTETPSQANFNQCWNSPHSTGVPSPADPALMNQYQMNPLLVVEYQEQTWQYEQYGQHGYTGLANEGMDHFMGNVESAGEFSRIGPPPPGGG